jgi:hypothetical protein
MVMNARLSDADAVRQISVAECGVAFRADEDLGLGEQSRSCIRLSHGFLRTYQ